MANQLRKTGIDVLGDIPWGTHFCHFYQTKKDFVELLTAYFKTGLENNEYCLWAISNPFNVEKVIHSLEQSVSGFKDHLTRKSFEIIPITEWYLKEGKFNPKEIVSEWVQKLHEAQNRGFDGMRIHGNKGWLEEEDWESYQQYEKELSNSISNHRMIVLCTYPLTKVNASTFLDVVHLHECVVSTRKGEWKVLQNTEIEQMHVELKKKNQELEVHVEQRTRELEETIRKLENEIAERKKAEASLNEEKKLSDEIIDSIPGLFALFDENLRFVRWNKSFETVSGYTPEEIMKLHGIESFFDNEEDKQRTSHILNEIFEKGSGSAEVSPLMKDGTPVTLLFSGRSFKYEGKIYLITTGIDITEQKKIEAKFKTVIEQSLLGFYIISDRKFAYVNPQLAKIFGYRQEELIGALVEIVIHPDDREMVAEHVRVRMEGEKDRVHYEAKGVKKNGETIRIEVFCSGTLKGKSKAIMGTLIDVTERKIAEERLRQSEQLLSEAEHLAHIGSWSTDIQNGTVAWSNEHYQIFGIRPEDFDNRLDTVLQFTHPDDKDFVYRAMEEAIKTKKPFDFHYRIIRSQGEERILHVCGAVLTDDQETPTKLYGAVQDVTESKQAEEELRLAYKRLSYHVENTPLAVIEWNKDLFITRWSGQAEKIFGWKASEVLGKNIYDSDIALIYKEDEEKVKNMAHEVLHKSIERNFNINRNYTKDKKVIYCEWHNSVLRDEAGNIITIMSLGQDVTERTIAKEKLSESYNQIRSLTEYLQNVREEERTNIAREIHDELGQQLTVIKMDVAWLNKRLSQTNEAVKEKIQGLLHLLDETVQSVRRIASELRPSMLDDLGLAPAMEWHLNEFRKRSGIKISFHEPKEELELPAAVKTGLFRVLQESLTNVVRHSKATMVQVELSESNKHLLLHIKDNGIGFDHEKVAQKKTLGILGMKERSAMMGGSYEIRSEPGKGTEILVDIPLSSKV
jgi:PAS domain S-box-containing protein